MHGDDVSHVVTEEGIAYLFKAEGIEERRAALAAVAGITTIGARAQPARTAALRARGIVAFPSDIGVNPLQASRSLLAARSVEELAAWSGGLYKPPSFTAVGGARVSNPVSPHRACEVACRNQSPLDGELQARRLAAEP